MTNLGYFQVTAMVSGQYVRAAPLPEQLPDTMAVTWKYPKFVMTYTNCVRQGGDFDVQGNYFLGTVGWLQVNRTGYRFRANPAPRGTTAPLPFEPVSQSFPY